MVGRRHNLYITRSSYCQQQETPRFQFLFITPPATSAHFVGLGSPGHGAIHSDWPDWILDWQLKENSVLKISNLFNPLWFILHVLKMLMLLTDYKIVIFKMQSFYMPKAIAQIKNNCGFYFSEYKWPGLKSQNKIMSSREDHINHVYFPSYS